MVVSVKGIFPRLVSSMFIVIIKNNCFSFFIGFFIKTQLKSTSKLRLVTSLLKVNKTESKNNWKRIVLWKRILL